MTSNKYLKTDKQIKQKLVFVQKLNTKIFFGCYFVEYF